MQKPLSVYASFKNGQFYDLFTRTVCTYDLVKFADREEREERKGCFVPVFFYNLVNNGKKPNMVKLYTELWLCPCPVLRYACPPSFV